MKDIRYVESLNKALHGLMQTDENVFVMGEDILDPYGGAFKVTKGLSTAFPDRVLSTPISESSITGFATGLAIRGFRPVLEIMFGDFITLCTDQIINGATKYHGMYNEIIPVPLVIRTPMGGRRGYGPTHSQTLESLFLGITGLNIIAPSNYHNPGDLLYQTVLNNNKPTLFIENKSLYSERLKIPDNNGKVDDFFYSIKSNSDKNYPSISLKLAMEEKPDVTLVTYGGMAQICAEAAMNVFLEEEILVEILLPSLVKPFPIEDILTSVQESGRVIIVEEGIKTSGWGAEMASQINEKVFHKLKKPIVRIGALEVPIPSSKTLEEEVLPQVHEIERSLLNIKLQD
jgi:pyruvate/2-oxoglutarate/acetoin dehydrogenase E1 component